MPRVGGSEGASAPGIPGPGGGGRRLEGAAQMVGGLLHPAAVACQAMAVVGCPTAVGHHFWLHIQTLCIALSLRGGVAGVTMD